MTEEIEIPLASTDKYEEALAKARFEYKENPCATESEKRVLEIIFPELKESEDEKIRQALIAYFRGMTHDVFVNGFSKEDFIAWLEKQKDAETEIEKAYKNADKIQYEKGLEDGVASVKQKEQKPAEIDEYEIIKKHITEDSLSSEVNKRLAECGWYVTYEKPAEWNEEDEEMLKWLCRIVHSQRVTKVITLKEESELGKWMDKWLHHNPQPKQEWSEEDKKMLDDITVFVSGYADTRVVNDWVAFLKSLRPQSHWKPSEEQMEALLWCAAHLGGADHRVLAELYEHLKMYCL